METEGKRNRLTALLAELSPGYYPRSIFRQLCRLTATPIIEIVPLWKNKVNVEVLLLKRVPDDPLGSFDDALRRTLRDELKETKVTPSVFVKTILHHSGRGMEAAQVYWVELLGTPKISQFHRTRD